ncbi:uncharacterized protein CDAR_167541 [Caerostris darwini]|uniref:Uncharacterized protein n=1 Tax=Caerostris darwini TaxID=1538125 RepID=A0AAV4M8D5_9ARAC|nr:uncharacterized protein CDAR_167541 [Caerostris darwini]
MAEKHTGFKHAFGKENAHVTEKERIANIVRDNVIVSKIEEKEISLSTDEDLEKKQIADDYETIIKKQLQMLQADERGRQALQAEIAEIRRLQEKRDRALKARAKALEIEKIRAKKIASRPPPLPQSVKLLLKDKAKQQYALSTEDFNSELSLIQEGAEEEFEDLEDKENMDEEYLEEKKRKQDEWDRKAKQRFNEALRKDRQKQEHNEILKEIENAERLSRRQMARNVSDPVNKVPCCLPDKLHYAEKQIAMEDAVENIFKKNKSIKEHAVEDLEGYEDKWEAKYKKIDSVKESKMIDCVPTFVKDNYSYLLQDETTLQCGRRFSGLDDSCEDLNEAYIETSPADVINSSEEIDAVINRLDQMQSEWSETYEKEFKPLLEAEAVPKIILMDKAVETDTLKLPSEDKGIEIDSKTSPKKVQSSSRSVQVDLLQGGVMTYKRRDLGSMYRRNENDFGSYLPHPGITSTERFATESKSYSSTLGSWSSSSYRSLPSKHGLPNVCRFCDSPNCAIPLVEDEKLHKDCIPLAKGFRKLPDDLNRKLPENTEDIITSDLSIDETPPKFSKAKLSTYIQLVADKFLKNKPATSTESLSIQKEVPRSADYSPKSDLESYPAFSKTKAVEQIQISAKDTEKTNSSKTSVSFDEVFTHKEAEFEKDTLSEQHEYDQFDFDAIKYPDYLSEKALIINLDHSVEDELLQKCQEMISTQVSDAFSSENKDEFHPTEIIFSNEQSADFDEVTDKEYKKESLTGYVYHDLSTIPEIDSALTNESAHSATKELSFEETDSLLRKTSLPKKLDLKDNLPGEVDAASVSLVDVPESEITELAKSIRFVRKLTPVKKLSPEPIQPLNNMPEEYPFLTGTLTSIETPPSAVKKIISPKSVDIRETPLPSNDKTSSHSSISIKTLSDGSELNGLTTPSSLSTLQSQSSAKSESKPYSSSFRDSHVASSSALSKYFRDISSVRQESDTSSKREDFKQLKFSTDSSLKSSSKSKQDMQFYEKFQDKHISSVKKNLHKQFDMYDSSSDSFKPMTPQSYLSIPSGTYHEDNLSNKNNHFLEYPLKQNVSKGFHTPESNFDSFKPMTPHTYLSSPSNNNLKYSPVDNKPFSLKNQVQQIAVHQFSNPPSKQKFEESSFKPLSLYSDLSTPENTIARHKNRNSSEKNEFFLQDNVTEQYENSGGSYFHPMTPHSYLSSPSKNYTPGRLIDNSAKKIEANSDNLRLKIPYSSRKDEYLNDDFGRSDVQRDAAYLKSSPEGKTIKKYLEDKDGIQQGLSENDLLKGDPYMRQSMYLMSSKASEKKIYGSQISQSVSDFNKFKHTKEDENAVKIPSSGFVPQLTSSDFALFISNKKADNGEPSLIKEVAPLKSIKTSPYKTESSSPYSLIDKIIPSISFISDNNIKDLKNSEKTLPKTIISPVKNELDYVPLTSAIPVKSPNPILQALKWEYAIKENPNLRTPCTTPSNGSSSENLLEMFTESKITFQSTPIKSIEEIIQETGILEEPDLTLMNTEFTIKPESPEKTRLFPDSNLQTPSIIETGLMPMNLDMPNVSNPYSNLQTPSNIETVGLTPRSFEMPNEALSSPYSCDSPSMISFLKHEQSALSTSNRENQHSVMKTPSDVYKIRTKRLWNNLEEVKTKKMMEEKREQLMKNRLKMKAYSRKFTPKKKAT